MKKLLFLIATTVLLTACGSKESIEVESTETVTTEIATTTEAVTTEEAITVTEEATTEEVTTDEDANNPIQVDGTGNNVTFEEGEYRGSDPVNEEINEAANKAEEADTKLESNEKYNKLSEESKKAVDKIVASGVELKNIDLDIIKMADELRAEGSLTDEKYDKFISDITIMSKENQQFEDARAAEQAQQQAEQAQPQQPTGDTDMPKAPELIDTGEWVGVEIH